MKLFAKIVDAKTINLLRANPKRWSNTLKPFVAKLPTNGLSVFDHFVGLAIKGLTLAKSSIVGV